MDPNEALRKARAALARLMAAKDVNGTAMAGGELADAFEALDGWLSNGGFLPTDWRRGCPTCEPPKG